jgi:hypothetical protein
MLALWAPEACSRRSGGEAWLFPVQAGAWLPHSKGERNPCYRIKLLFS